MSNDRSHIEKGMFLRGGTYPERTVTARHRPLDHSCLDHPDTIRELKARLQNLKEALDYIRNEKPPAVETQEQWLKRMGYL